ncbi:hypothetical protein EDC14_105013 [Hydrogenispora ethanolica]|uniref:Uncharacterized protein n=1 Tax=Hydrogenispora ethanolica TaxID=1082276 RepID=A0A4R1QRG5_HYDET|nr:hypothetical protein EDC14_105013 [Hydrogenispora ethanolica]
MHNISKQFLDGKSMSKMRIGLRLYYDMDYFAVVIFRFEKL